MEGNNLNLEMNNARASQSNMEVQSHSEDNNEKSSYGGREYKLTKTDKVIYGTLLLLTLGLAAAGTTCVSKPELCKTETTNIVMVAGSIFASAGCCAATCITKWAYDACVGSPPTDSSGSISEV